MCSGAQWVGRSALLSGRGWIARIVSSDTAPAFTYPGAPGSRFRPPVPLPLAPFPFFVLTSLLFSPSLIDPFENISANKVCPITQLHTTCITVTMDNTNLSDYNTDETNHTNS